MRGRAIAGIGALALPEKLILTPRLYEPTSRLGTVVRLELKPVHIKLIMTDRNLAIAMAEDEMLIKGEL